MGLYTTALVRVVKTFLEAGIEGKSLCMVGRQNLLVRKETITRVMRELGVDEDWDWDKMGGRKGIIVIPILFFVR